MQDKLELFKRFNALFLRGGDLYKYNVDVLENISECVHVISGKGEVPGGAGVGSAAILGRHQRQPEASDGRINAGRCPTHPRAGVVVVGLVQGCKQGEHSTLQNIQGRGLK